MDASAHTDGSGEVQSSVDPSVHGHLPSGIFDASQLHLVLRFVVVRHVHSFACSETGSSRLLPTITGISDTSDSLVTITKLS